MQRCATSFSWRRDVHQLDETTTHASASRGEMCEAMTVGDCGSPRPIHSSGIGPMTKFEYMNGSDFGTSRAIESATSRSIGAAKGSPLRSGKLASTARIDPRCGGPSAASDGYFLTARSTADVFTPERFSR